MNRQHCIAAFGFWGDNEENWIFGRKATSQEHLDLLRNSKLFAVWGFMAGQTQRFGLGPVSDFSDDSQNDEKNRMEEAKDLGEKTSSEVVTCDERDGLGMDAQIS